MKKEYIILIAVIIGLVAYLALKKDNRLNYELPSLPAIDKTAIDRIDITRGDKTLTLSKTDGAWTVSDKAYPADTSAVNDMLDTLGDLTLSALVSESGDRVRYELDADAAVKVKAQAKGKEIRTLTIGKTAPSFNHTFVMLKDDTRIFQADKSFRTQFDKGVDEFRDKVVLAFKTEKINTLTLEKDGVKKVLTLTAPAQESDGKTGEQTDQGKDQEKDQKAEAKKPEAQWTAADGTPADQTAVKDLLASLSRLECLKFKNEAETEALKKEVPTCKITLENGMNLGLNLFASKEGEDIPGLSPQSPWAFDLASYKAGDITSYVDQILGLKKEEAPSDKS